MGNFAGHSLRRGFITNAAKKNIPIEAIKRVTGQRSSGVVLDYVAAATLDDDPQLLEIVGVDTSANRFEGAQNRNAP